MLATYGWFFRIFPSDERLLSDHRLAEASHGRSFTEDLEGEVAAAFGFLEEGL